MYRTNLKRVRLQFKMEPYSFFAVNHKVAMTLWLLVTIFWYGQFYFIWLCYTYQKWDRLKEKE